MRILPKTRYLVEVVVRLLRESLGIKNLSEIIRDYRNTSPRLEREIEVRHYQAGTGLIYFSATYEKLKAVTPWFPGALLGISQPLQRKYCVCGGLRNWNPFDEEFPWELKEAMSDRKPLTVDYDYDQHVFQNWLIIIYWLYSSTNYKKKIFFCRKINFYIIYSHENSCLHLHHSSHMMLQPWQCVWCHYWKSVMFPEDTFWFPTS